MTDFRRVRVAGVLLAAVAALCPGAAAGQLVQTPTTPRINLGISSGTPEDQTQLSLKLSTPVGLSIGRIEAVVTYPPALTFDKVTGVPISDNLVAVDTGAGAPAGDNATLHLTIKPAGTATALPRDVLVDLTFQVAKGTPTGVLSLGLQAKAFAPDGTPIPSLQAYDGRVNIQEAEVFYTCFFYMH